MIYFFIQQNTGINSLSHNSRNDSLIIRIKNRQYVKSSFSDLILLYTGDSNLFLKFRKCVDNSALALY